MKDKRKFEETKKKIINVLKKYNVKKAGIFGSFARGDYSKDSDVDILAEIPRKINLFDYVGIKLELEDKLKKKVDLVEYKLIREELKEQILNEEIRIL